MSISIKNILLFVIPFYLFSCANITPPTGGPKDEKPPSIVKEKSFPLPNTINYKRNVVELTFDENIAIENIQEQLLITPLEENPYKVIPRRNKIRLEFEKPFSPNTTYTFNFRESIKDITEGNVAQNLIIPFSTGPYLDSISISGNVVDLKTKIPQGNVLVSLYKNGDTLSPLNSKPMYLTKSTKEGNYIIQNIKSGTYDLYAIEDKNKNLKYEESEKFAFLKNVDLDSSQTNIPLEITYFDSTPPYIKRTKSFSKTYDLIFNEGVKDVSAKAEDTTALLFNTSRDGTTLTIYNKMNDLNENDSIPVTIQLTDSSDNVFNKEVKIFFTPDKEEIEEIVVMEFLPKDRKLNPKKATINILFNRPVTKYSLNEIIFKEDTTFQKLKLENITWINKSNLEISKEIIAKDSLFLILPENTFYYVNTPNSRDTIQFDIKKEGDFGSISGNITSNKSNDIIELLDNNYKVVEKLINPSSFSFTNLQPGTYFLRAIVDENNNNRWDSGNLKELIQPEPVYLLQNKIELRANWEIRDIEFEF